MNYFRVTIFALLCVPSYHALIASPSTVASQCEKLAQALGDDGCILPKNGSLHVALCLLRDARNQLTQRYDRYLAATLDESYDVFFSIFHRAFTADLAEEADQSTQRLLLALFTFHVTENSTVSFPFRPLIVETLLQFCAFEDSPASSTNALLKRKRIVQNLRKQFEALFKKHNPHMRKIGIKTVASRALLAPFSVNDGGILYHPKIVWSLTGFVFIGCCIAVVPKIRAFFDNATITVRKVNTTAGNLSATVMQIHNMLHRERNEQSSASANADADDPPTLQDLVSLLKDTLTTFDTRSLELRNLFERLVDATESASEAVEERAKHPLGLGNKKKVEKPGNASASQGNSSNDNESSN